MTTGFTQVFGGGPVQPSNQLYVQLTLTGNVQLSWPLESSQTTAVVADLMDVTALSSGFTIQMPDARQGSQGLTSIINNIGSSFNVLDNLGNVILTSAPGTVWFIYLVSNTTQQGVWRTFLFGANNQSVNVAALAGAGLQVIGSALAAAMPSQSFSTSYTAAASSLANTFIWTGGSGSLTLPPAASLNALWFIAVVNAGTGTLTIFPQTGNIDNTSSKSIAVAGSCFVFTDGTNFWSLGYGVPSASNGFGYINVSLPASGTYTISGAQLNQISYLLTGALTGSVTFQVPASVQQYWINNQTTGNQTLTVASAGGGASVVVGQDTQVILYCDGTNIISAVTGTTLPIGVAEGGTGATTATGAVTNLGGTAIGAALFTTASAPAALTTLGGGTTGIAVFESANAPAAWSSIISSSPVTNGLYGSSFGLFLNAGGSNIAFFGGANIFLNVPVQAYESGYGVNALRPVGTVSTGIFTASCVGITGVSGIACQYTRVGSSVLLQIGLSGTLTGTGTGTVFSISIPAEIVPNNSVYVPIADGSLEDNGTVLIASQSHAAAASINASGTTLSFIKDASSTNWVAGGTRGINEPFTIVYSLA